MDDEQSCCCNDSVQGYPIHFYNRISALAYPVDNKRNTWATLIMDTGLSRLLYNNAKPATTKDFNGRARSQATNLLFYCRLLTCKLAIITLNMFRQFAFYHSNWAGVLKREATTSCTFYLLTSSSARPSIQPLEPGRSWWTVWGSILVDWGTREMYYVATNCRLYFIDSD